MCRKIFQITQLDGWNCLNSANAAITLSVNIYENTQYQYCRSNIHTTQVILANALLNLFLFLWLPTIPTPKIKKRNDLSSFFTELSALGILSNVFHTAAHIPPHTMATLSSSTFLNNSSQSCRIPVLLLPALPDDCCLFSWSREPPYNAWPLASSLILRSLDHCPSSLFHPVVLTRFDYFHLSVKIPLAICRRLHFMDII